MKSVLDPHLPNPANPFLTTAGWPLADGGKVARPDRREDGPIRIQLNAVLQARISSALFRLETPVRLLEFGCGANPSKSLLRHCQSYTGVDNSGPDLQRARASFADADVSNRFCLSSPCSLPFEDGEFDAAFAPGMVSCLDDPERQKRAISELIRVTRPGGMIIILARNPRPFLFSGGPVSGEDHARPLHWMQSALAECERVCTFSAGMASEGFDRRVSEYRYPGKVLWQAIRRVEMSWPGLAARLGCNVVYICRK